MVEAGTSEFGEARSGVAPSLRRYQESISISLQNPAECNQKSRSSNSSSTRTRISLFFFFFFPPDRPTQTATMFFVQLTFCNQNSYPSKGIDAAARDQIQRDRRLAYSCCCKVNQTRLCCSCLNVCSVTRSVLRFPLCPAFYGRTILLYTRRECSRYT